MPHNSILQIVLREVLMLHLTRGSAMTTKQLFTEMLEAMNVKNLMMQDLVLMQEYKYGLAKKIRLAVPNSDNAVSVCRS